MTGAEKERGILAPGYAADLAVLDRDPLDAPIAELTDFTAALTMVGGRIVHERE